MSKRVLFLEDQEKTANQTIEFLRTLELDLEVVHVTSVFQARSKLDSFESPFDFAIVDVMQEGEPHGLELVKDIAFRTPCIVVSAHVNSIKKDQLLAAGNIRFLDRNSKIWESLRSVVKQISDDLDFVEVNRKQPNVHRSRSHSSLYGAVLVTRNWLNPASKIDPHEMIMEWDFAHLASVASVVETEVNKEGGHVVSMDGVACMTLFQESGPGDCLLERALNAAKRIHRELNGQNGGELRPVSCGFVEGQVMSGLFGVRYPGIAGVVGRTSDVAWQLATLGKPGLFLCVADLLSSNSKEYIASKGNQQSLKLVGFSDPSGVVSIPLD